MGRYLPWRDGPADESRPRKRIKAGPSTDDLRAKREKQKDEAREDEYMHPGIKNDDQYIMVEDEFLQIAKSYTAKLHSAELARLQAQIALRKSQKIAASQHSQPRIPGSMPKKRQVVLQRRAHDAAIRKAAGIQTDKDAEGESYNPKFSSQSLGRLMTTSAVRIDSTLPLPLTPGKAIKPATRAAAGFTKASFKKTTSSQISPSQLKSSQIAKEGYNNIYGRESYDEDDEDLDLMPRRSSSIRIPPKLTPIERPTSSYASDKRISISKQPLRPTCDSKLLSSSPQGSQRPFLLSSSPPRQLSRTFKFSSTPKTSLTQNPKPGLPIADSDSDNDYADAEQAARWRHRSLPKHIAVEPIHAPSSTYKSKPIIPKSSDNDEDDDYADAEQAARFRRRKQFAEAQRSGAKS
ncbi:hypothetical protein AOL_s00004g365 [Orbilia oligospora ATCC 24927]|uniref:Uncharacterized protein n=2 Tax=Orbilia oligospora TaxID=2813651 RepID=G1WYK5_ARTOA|nr:hypothetical protein AOL_s00004g365 [Orbilia oligospora ATCC 24927]EGX54332.1 hypothetical protein AOL_s00004g365 [Orbilia oligospora ATCC 24927]KAF3278162.1 hypothetical protein TWF970_004618 [Orbilia oligospora]